MSKRINFFFNFFNFFNIIFSHEAILNMKKKDELWQKNTIKLIIVQKYQKTPKKWEKWDKMKKTKILRKIKNGQKNKNSMKSLLCKVHKIPASNNKKLRQKTS